MNYTEELKKLEQRIAEIREDMKKAKSKAWKPKDGDEVWILQVTADVHMVTYNQRFEGYYLMGMLSPTKEKAQKARDRQLAKMRIIRALREHEGDWVADWSDKSQNKCRVYYDHCFKRFYITQRGAGQSCETEMYSTKASCQWVIDNMQDDLKLYFGVE